MRGLGGYGLGVRSGDPCLRGGDDGGFFFLPPPVGPLRRLGAALLRGDLFLQLLRGHGGNGSSGDGATAGLGSRREDFARGKVRVEMVCHRQAG